MTPVTLLHVFSTFGPGGPQIRTIDTLTALGPEFCHLILAMDGVTTATARIPPALDYRLLSAPRSAGPLAFRRFFRDTPCDLVLTYNWGAIEAALGARLARRPLIHAEHGFGPDEATRRKSRRVLFRRYVLRGAHAVVVPSKVLYHIALHEYRLPLNQVHYIRNGVDLQRFAPAPPPDRIPVIGAVANLRPEKNLDLLLHAFAALPLGSAHLLLVGDGPSRTALQQTAARLGCADRITWAGPVTDPAPLYRDIDIFALSSSTEQMPMALLEAMASGLPAVCTDVGDCSAIIGERQVPAGNVQAFTAALRALVENRALRQRHGAANRRRCEQLYSRDAMIEAYRALYRSAYKQAPTRFTTCGRDCVSGSDV